jgi:hypothetical protein
LIIVPNIENQKNGKAYGSTLNIFFSDRKQRGYKIKILSEGFGLKYSSFLTA